MHVSSHRLKRTFALRSYTLAVGCLAAACVGDTPVLQQPFDGGPGADTSTIDGAVPLDGGDASTGPVTIAWLRQIGSSDDENSNSVALDSQGNAFVGGSFLASVKSGNVTLNNQGNDGTTDGFVMKLAPDGSTVAGKVFGGPKTQIVSKVAVDKQGTPFALVHFLGQAIVGSTTLTSVDQGNDFVVVKLDANVNYVDHVAGMGPGVQVAWQMTGWGAGVLLCGSNAGTMSNFLGSDLVATTPGQPDTLFARLFSGSDVRAQYVTKTSSSACSLSVDSGNNYVLGGQSFTVPVNFGVGQLTPGNNQSLASDSFVVSFTVADVAKWNTQLYAPPGSAAGGYLVAATPGGDVYGGGYIVGPWNASFTQTTFTANTASGFVYKLSPAGTYIWSKVVPDTKFTAFATDKIGRLLACGRIDADTDLGKGTVKHQGAGDVAVVIYAANGDVDYAATFGDSSFQECDAIAFAANGDVVVEGRFTGTLKMGNDSITTLGGNDVFVARIKSP